MTVLYKDVFLIFCACGILTALLLIPFRFFASRIGMVDKPDANRKLHEKPIPVGGGTIIFVVLTALIAVLGTSPHLFEYKLALSQNLLFPLFTVSPLLVLVGLLDDKFGMSGKIKLLCQIAAASIVIGFAKEYNEVVFFGYELNLQHLFYPCAVFWVIGVINSINLLDGADGTASTVSFWMALATAGIAFINGQYGICLISIALAGCLTGFFIHNAPPARVYLGDTGSMLVGLMLGTLMLRASIDTHRTISVVGPLAIVLIPMMDSFLAVIRRVNSGRSIFSADRGHIHHLLASRFRSQYAVLLALSLLVIPGCAAALIGASQNNDWIPAGTAVGICSLAFLFDLFGKREVLILFGRFKGRFRLFFHKKKYLEKNGEIYHIQGSGPWRDIWRPLVSDLKSLSCARIQLDINIPFAHENFYGEWKNAKAQNKDDFFMFKCSQALFVNDRNVGYLRIRFFRDETLRREMMEASLKALQRCEDAVNDYLTQSGNIIPFPNKTQEQKAA